MLNISTTIQKSKIKALAIGCFDGLHLGHLELIKHLGENSALLVIDKFASKKLCTNAQKKELSKKELIELDFKSIMAMEGEDFLEALKKEFVNLEHIVVGYDFYFGKDKKYKASDIERLSGLKTTIIAEFKKGGKAVHTSLIKDFLSKGEVEKANELLGRVYSIEGNLIKGQGLGAKRLFATLNLECEEYFLPKNGVYASFCKIKERIYKSVSFIGVRFSDNNFAIETHILEDFKLYLRVGEKIKLGFVKFLRENKNFKDLSLLKYQISRDIEEALEILKEKNERRTF